MNTFVQILIASVGFGAGMEGLGQYRKYKARRRLRDFGERNTGFWTDRRLYRAEASFAAIALAMPWTWFALTIPINRPLWIMTVVLLSYAFAIYVLISNLNRPDAQ